MPPSPNVGATGLCDLKEWGSVVTPDEIFSLDDLDEFVNTNLNSIFVHHEQPESVTRKRKGSADSVSESQSKRRKLETGALYDLIHKVRDIYFYRKLRP